MRDDQWGETVLAVIVPKFPSSPPSEATLDAFARDRLAGYKVPRRYAFTDALPRNPSGKILKRELRKPYWEGQDRQVH